jgi:mRNA-degrading endonuclease RelE of RelBE toxin-antitoxin system
MLTSWPESRLRAGDWRVLIRLDHHALVVVVLQVRPRGRV